MSTQRFSQPKSNHLLCLISDMAFNGVVANGGEPIDEMMHGLMINEEAHQDFEEIQETEAEIKKDPTLIARQ